MIEVNLSKVPFQEGCTGLRYRVSGGNKIETFKEPWHIPWG